MAAFAYAKSVLVLVIAAGIVFAAVERRLPARDA